MGTEARTASSLLSTVVHRQPSLPPYSRSTPRAWQGTIRYVRPLSWSASVKVSRRWPTAGAWRSAPVVTVIGTADSETGIAEGAGVVPPLDEHPPRATNINTSGTGISLLSICSYKRGRSRRSSRRRPTWQPGSASPQPRLRRRANSSRGPSLLAAIVGVRSVSEGLMGIESIHD